MFLWETMMLCSFQRLKIYFCFDIFSDCCCDISRVGGKVLFSTFFSQTISSTFSWTCVGGGRVDFFKILFMYFISKSFLVITFKHLDNPSAWQILSSKT